VTLHVDIAGEGPALVLLHGWGLHSGVWSEVMPRLASRYRVHAIDLPGHGYSAAEPVGSFDECVDSVAHLIPPGSTLCGWSLGGLVAQHVAKRHAEKVENLVLVSTTPCFVARADWPAAVKEAVLEEFARDLWTDRRGTLESFVRLNALNGARGREAIRVFTARLFERGAPPEAALSASLAWLGDSDLRGDARDLPAGTLVIHGERDVLTPIEAGRWLAATIPGGKLVELPDAAHIPFFTHPDAFVGAVESSRG
jgi:pimeloyl-[acyl-carrier protein] methyl ester esterase